MNSSVSLALVGLGDRLGGGGGAQPLRVHDRVVGELGPLPAAVAIHRVVAAADRGDAPGVAQPALELLEVAGRGLRQRVAPVGERVHDEVGHALLRGELDAGLDVLPARVHAAVGDEAHQVQPPARAVSGRRAGRAQRLVLEEAAVRDRIVDPGQVLLDDRAGAEVHVADLRVAHLAVGQADVATAGREGRVRVALPELVEDRRRRLAHRVSRPVRGQAPAVEDDEGDGGGGDLGSAAGDGGHANLLILPPPRRSPGTPQPPGTPRRPGRRRSPAGRRARRRWRP